MSRQEQLGALGAEWDDAEARNTALNEANSKLAIDLASAQQAVDQRDLEITQLNSDLAAANFEIKRLRDLYEPKPCVFGVSAPQNTPGGAKLMTPGERIFFDPGKHYSSVGSSGQLYDALNRLAEGGTLWHSFKDRAGQWTRDLYTDIYIRWPDVRILATAYHEPKDNFDYRTPSSWGQWLSLQDSFEAAVGDLDFVEMVTITEAYNNPTRAPGYWDAMLRERQAFGFDSYNSGIGAPKQYVDPAVLHKPILDFTNANKPGQKLLVGETGSGITADTDTSRAGRRAWLIANQAYFAEYGDVAMWWNSGSNGPLGQGCKLDLNDLTTWLDG